MKKVDKDMTHPQYTLVGCGNLSLIVVDTCRPSYSKNHFIHSLV